MDDLLLKVGAQYQMDGTSAEIIHIDEELVTLRHLHYHSTFYYRRDLFTSDLRNKNIIEIASTPGAGSNALAFLNPDDPHVINANRKFRYVSEALKAFGGVLPVEATRLLIKAIGEKMNDAHPPSYSALYQWIRIYKDHNFDKFSLFKSKSREPRGIQIETEVMESIDHHINKYYLDKSCISQQRLYAFVDGDIIAKNQARSSYSNHFLKSPSISTIRRRIKKLCQYSVDLKRHGNEYAQKKHHFSRKRPEPAEALYLAEIDSHRVDTEIVDQNGYVVGAIAWLVTIIDIKTRVIIGWELSLTPPCAEKSIRALISAVCMVPGEEYQRGKMIYLLSDNGPEFKNKWFIAFIDKLGILQAFAPPKSPNARARGERFFKTFESWLHEQPGSTVSGVPYRCGNNLGKQKPFFTIEQLQRYFRDWLENVYHIIPHRSLKKPPKVAWEQAMKNRLAPEKFTGEALNALCRKVVYSKITKGRVHFLCLSWTGPSLPEMAARLNGRDAICYYDPGDLGQVWVAHPDNPRDTINAFSTNPGYQDGLTESEHKKLKELEKVESSKYDLAAPHVALLRMRQEIDEGHHLNQPQRSNKNNKTGRPKSNSKKTKADRFVPNVSPTDQSIITLPVDYI
jgi:transposase InsO family protein